MWCSCILCIGVDDRRGSLRCSGHFCCCMDQQAFLAVKDGQPEGNYDQMQQLTLLQFLSSAAIWKFAGKNSSKSSSLSWISLQIPSITECHIDKVDKKWPPPLLSLHCNAILGNEIVEHINSTHVGVIGCNEIWMWYADNFPFTARKPFCSKKWVCGLEITCQRHYTIVIPFDGCNVVCFIICMVK